MLLTSRTRSPGWYFGDFHMHAYHSNLNAPSMEESVQFALDARLDFMPITEYVINRHWNEWGTVASENPDMIVWPGREVITYFGHAGIIGETPGMIEYRHGYKGISMTDIQAGSVARGALFQVNHPTTWPPPFDFQCRGCVWELDDFIDYNLVDTIEVVNVGVRSGSMPNPFVETAIKFWEGKIQQGYFIAPVGGSDDKLGPRYGNPATVVYASELSRAALKEGVRAGHVWIAAVGKADSPTIEFTATAGEQTAMFGDTLNAESAEFTVHVTGGQGQTLRIFDDTPLLPGSTPAVPILVVPIDSDDFTYSFVGTSSPTDNPLGNYYRIETRDPSNSNLLSTLGMPIFLKP